MSKVRSIKFPLNSSYHSSIWTNYGFYIALYWLENEEDEENKTWYSYRNFSSDSVVNFGQLNDVWDFFLGLFARRMSSWWTSLSNISSFQVPKQLKWALHFPAIRKTTSTSVSTIHILTPNIFVRKIKFCENRFSVFPSSLLDNLKTTTETNLSKEFSK